MPRRIEKQEEEIAGIEEVRKYAERHKKYARLMYGTLLRGMKALNISGRYLEIGAGPAFLAIMIAQRNPDIRITAIDLSPDMVAVGNQYIRESNLQDRIRYLVGDVNDQTMMKGLGRFDLVYSTFSLHHWRDPEKSISNLWNAVGDNGVMYIYDFRRVGCLCFLPLRGGEIDSIRSSYTPSEIKGILQKVGIANYKTKALFPFFFLQSIIALKQTPA